MYTKRFEDKQTDEYDINASDKQEKEDSNDSLVNILIDFIKDELLKSNIRYEIVKPILIYMLYYLIPFIILLMVLNFLTTIIAVYIVFKYLL
jgi:flagellar biosynthesis protein FlhB